MSLKMILQQIIILNNDIKSPNGNNIQYILIMISLVIERTMIGHHNTIQRTEMSKSDTDVGLTNSTQSLAPIAHRYFALYQKIDHGTYQHIVQV